MSPMLWLLAAGLLVPYVPYLYVVWAKRMSPEGYDAHDPRGQSARLDGLAKRAQAAHLNAMEGLTPFLFAGLLVTYVGADGLAATALAAIWHLARIAYVVFYLADIPVARSGVWGVALLAVFAMVGLAAFGHA